MGRYGCGADVQPRQLSEFLNLPGELGVERLRVVDRVAAVGIDRGAGRVAGGVERAPGQRGAR